MARRSTLKLHAAALHADTEPVELTDGLLHDADSNPARAVPTALADLGPQRRLELHCRWQRAAVSFLEETLAFAAQDSGSTGIDPERMLQFATALGKSLSQLERMKVPTEADGLLDEFCRVTTVFAVSAVIASLRLLPVDSPGAGTQDFTA